MFMLSLLIDPPLTGAENMARDEALLDACRHPDDLPTLRFYSWSPPTVSLGYFQSYSEFEALSPPAGAMAVVRRPTGGGAILHDLEVTYSLVVPITHPWIRSGPNQLYQHMHRAIIDAVGPPAQMGPPGGNGSETSSGISEVSSCDDGPRHGPFFCFARRHPLDVLAPDPNDRAGRQKLAGSAQRRGRQAVLQHGSIILKRRFVQQPCAAWSWFDRGITFESAVERLGAAVERYLGARLMPVEWTQAALESALNFRQMHLSEAWLRERTRFFPGGTRSV